MILVPEDRAEIFDKLSNLDHQMQDILRNKTILESEKANQYLQVLQKFVKIHHPQREVIEETVEKKEPVLEDGNNITTKILNSAPIRYQQTAKNILDFLKDKHSTISWTPEGEIIYKSERLPRTNIVSLITDLLRNRKNSPKGSTEFHAALREINIPKNFIVNRKIFKPEKLVKSSVRKCMYAKKKAWISY
ncbi:uncharacterized protein TNCV_3531341 [Trichonephila clavipes]|uniref:Uncharacterized protein n=1 Tax=Trichonephila clavipes TaxID=2585209 RepID=A0A8X6SXG4_TRICX|nr:uncharacterized protein TNCV_3531341 [Trichonephila clavipes]